MPVYFYKMKQGNISLDHMLSGQRQQTLFYEAIHLHKKEERIRHYPVQPLEFHPGLTPTLPCQTADLGSGTQCGIIQSREIAQLLGKHSDLIWRISFSPVVFYTKALSHELRMETFRFLLTLKSPKPNI